jgi:uncharacterized protein (DUF1501 family)
MLTTNRSHFVCQDYMERGYYDSEPKQNTGWLTRHVADLGTDRPAFADVANSPVTPAAFLNDSSALAIPDVATFNVTGGAAYAAAIRALNSGGTIYEGGIQKTLDAIASVQAGLSTVSTSPDAQYTNGDFSRPLRSLAKLIKMNVGVSVATVDMTAWDHHQALNNAFRGRAIELSQSLSAFWTDIAAFQDRVTIVTMTEFGRRFAENTSGGLDHGSASTMLVMGAGVDGGRIYGTWPGLAPTVLNSGDLAVTTDYRQVLAEVIAKRHGETTLNRVFPTITYAPLGILRA